MVIIRIEQIKRGNILWDIAEDTNVLYNHARRFLQKNESKCSISLKIR